MKIELNLTLEQPFKLTVFLEESKSLSEKEMRILLVEIVRQNMVKDNAIKHLLKNPNA
jgi:Phycobilisome degradation protein nblA.|uniref:NblA n=1 Tax=uncultured Phormidium sp. TaxID=259949 RepID=W0FFW9_9CYAN|nr:NblA [uncultured Phormidium sp.]